MMHFSNHLSNETSPYLRQHMHNPVDWYPWGNEALQKALQENKPILLSIGYSACHWCHVMAHESFEDEETAVLMNQYFMNIKVDREERPDIDKIYQTVHQMFSQSPGGWPLTIFLDPKYHVPFFTGTYFPKEPRYQLPGFKELLQHLQRFYTENQQNLFAQAPEVIAHLQAFSTETPSSQDTLSMDPWHQAITILSEDYDAVNGGFGSQPKFPSPMNLELLLRDVVENEIRSFDMTQTTLTHMALGGLFDQVGGGFYRYSVDAKWHIPHFEKMLYDNAQLLYQYAQANAVHPNPLFVQVVKQTARWIVSDMQSLEGSYYSSLDADSEGKEGQYYLWTPQQMNALLNQDEAKVFLARFNLQDPPNFEHAWHLHVTHTIEQVAQQCHLSTEAVDRLLASALNKLQHARSQRILPGLDGKILTSWNALMIKGMAFAGFHLKEVAWIESAEKALIFIHKHLWQKGRLLATYKDRRAHLEAYLDDYAFLIDAILTFLQYRWRTEFLLFAMELAEVLIKHFEDPQGGFYFVADDHEALLYRPKTLVDNVTPSGSGMACYALQRLGYLLAEPRYLSVVEKALKSAWSVMNQYPAAPISLLLALREYLTPPQIIIIRGEQKELKSWQEAIQKSYSPSRLIFTINHEEVELPPALASKLPGNQPIAYICEGLKCLPPLTTYDDLVSQIKDVKNAV